ncbi:hypothetical protein Trydic_g11408 [Trypoxylus dichotomus]
MEGSLVNYTFIVLNPVEFEMEEDVVNITAPEEIATATILIANGHGLSLHEAYLPLVCYCAFVITVNLAFMYIILRNNLNRSPFYLALLHISIFGTVYTACGVLATHSFVPQEMDVDVEKPFPLAILEERSHRTAQATPRLP